ncbi:MAG: terminase TerL endonuclease subunit [Treponema porcinum]|uniref:terminase large subunit n=1 Tax=Treponema porcinum TaxID=261392 RepID=UPI002A80859E|nr:terminase TerL endonuclease subunit [Treponema porcinum]MDY5048215.1 terminase TerL endonuclease subunit [Treponema porcinum]
MKAQEDDGFPFVFDEEAFNNVIDFAQSLKLQDIKSNLVLQPWQKFCYQIWAWKYKSDLERRRFRTAYIEVARKNGKTSAFLMPWILYDALTENASESYLASATEKQSQKSFEEITAIIKDNPELDSLFKCYSSAITYDTSRITFFSPQTSALDGYRNSLSILDEYHEYDSDRILTAFRYGGRARKNSTVAIITSAGNDINGACYAENKKAQSILKGTLEDDSYFTVIYAYNQEDDWKDAKNLIKANPALGSFLKEDVLLSDLNDAMLTPSHVPDFKSKTCGIWTNDVSNWISNEKWNKCCVDKIDWSDFEGAECWCGLDLSEVHDVTAFTLCFHKNGKFYFKHHFYVPSETIAERYQKENINFYDWADKGIVTVINGATIDYDFVFEDICSEMKNYRIREIAYDRWQANALISKLNEELPEIVYVDYDQSLKKFSQPSKDFEKAILDGAIVNDNPVMTWMVSNACIKITPNGDIKPQKDFKKPTQRIDGVITSIMALDRCKSNLNNPCQSFELVLNSF